MGGAVPAGVVVGVVPAEPAGRVGGGGRGGSCGGGACCGG